MSNKKVSVLILRVGLVENNFWIKACPYWVQTKHVRYSVSITFALIYKVGYFICQTASLV